MITVEVGFVNCHRLSAPQPTRIPELGRRTRCQTFAPASASTALASVRHGLKPRATQVTYFMSRAPGDGHPGLEKYIRSNTLLKECHILIDFYHAMEHLSLAAEAIFGKSSDAASKWFDKWRQLLLHREYSVNGLYRSMKYYSTCLHGAKREALRKEMNYFKKRKAKMNYAYYRNRALPIASGPVEAACKSIVKTRLGRSGMRWSRKGGQNVLNLRTYVKSGRWESFWKHHRADCYLNKSAA